MSLVSKKHRGPREEATGIQAFCDSLLNHLRHTLETLASRVPTIPHQTLQGDGCFATQNRQNHRVKIITEVDKIITEVNKIIVKLPTLGQDV